MNRTARRIIDANFNRAREALRVLEEHARMILDDEGMARRIKRCRHELVDAVACFGARELLTARDVTGDVGTQITTPQEQTRKSTEAVAIAAAKRAGESLRVIEEYGKTVDASVAARIESLRYVVYSVEQEIVLAGPRHKSIRAAKIHVLLTQSACREDWFVVAAAALRGGADVIQLREKQLSDGELLERSLKLRRLTREHQAMLIINDRADIALLSDADGVHVGLEDLPVAEVRRIVGPHRLIGATVHSIEEAKITIGEKPDYMGVGPMFASSTKPAVPVNGPALLHRIHEEMLNRGAGIPLVAIGGITTSNVDELRLPTLSEHCPVAIAVSQAVIGSDRSEVATRQLKSKLGQNMVALDHTA